MSIALARNTVRSAMVSIESDSAPTGYITARTAGKRATSHLQTTVGSDAKSIRWQLDADIRLAAAVGGAARYLADAAGLENEAVSQLQSAILAACQEAFGHLTA